MVLLNSEIGRIKLPFSSEGMRFPQQIQQRPETAINRSLRRHSAV
jgi:hypothetical protein